MIIQIDIAFSYIEYFYWPKIHHFTASGKKPRKFLNIHKYFIIFALLETGKTIFSQYDFFHIFIVKMH